MLRASQIPNLICVIRILLVLPILLLLLERRFIEALLLFFLAGISDGLDGYLAKRFDWRSRLGGLLDPLADKLLLVVTFLALTSLELVPVWLTVIVIGRDIVIVSGGLAYHWLIGSVEPAPTLISKTNTTLQIIYVFCVIGMQAFDWPLELITMLAGVGVFCTSAISGIDYVLRWSRKALTAQQG